MELHFIKEKESESISELLFLDGKMKDVLVWIQKVTEGLWEADTEFCAWLGVAEFRKNEFK